MELKFEIKTGTYYLESSDENEEDYKEIYYEVDDDKILKFVASCVYWDYFKQEKHTKKQIAGITNNIEMFIRDFDLLEKLAKETYLNEVVERFESEAVENSDE